MIKAVRTLARSQSALFSTGKLPLLQSHSRGCRSLSTSATACQAGRRVPSREDRFLFDLNGFLVVRGAVAGDSISMFAPVCTRFN